MRLLHAVSSPRSCLCGLATHKAQVLHGLCLCFFVRKYHHFFV
ncbi:hypothetical protein [Candidatus Campylobacter infans]|nr:hypothetical protein [Candidatus Campylobacter infans]